MNAFQNPEAFQKLMRSGVQMSGYVIAIGLGVFLVMAWLLTGPLFQLGDWITQTKDKKLKRKVYE